MAKPQYRSMEAIPPLSEIIPGLFQGMRPRTYRGYDLVVSCEEHLAKGPMENYDGVVIHIPMRDDDEFRIPTWQIAGVAAMIRGKGMGSYGNNNKENGKTYT